MRVNGISSRPIHRVPITIDVPGSLPGSLTIALARGLAEELRELADQYDLAAEELRVANSTALPPSDVPTHLTGPCLHRACNGACEARD